MRSAVSDVLPTFLSHFEGGFLTHMYADIKGLVTTGTGNLIDPLTESTLALDWRQCGSALPTYQTCDDCRPASREEIIDAFNTVKAQADPNAGGGSHHTLTTVRLSSAGVHQLFDRTAHGFEATLKGFFPEWESWPADAQLAILAFAWAMGPAFAPGWPHLSAALRAQDFRTAAEEAKSPSLRPEREAAQTQLLNNAADVVDDGGDRESFRTDLTPFGGGGSPAALTNIPGGGGTIGGVVALVLITAAIATWGVLRV